MREGTSKLLSLPVIPGEQNKTLALHSCFCLWERNEERSPIGQMLVRLPQVLPGGLQIAPRYVCVGKGATPSFHYCGLGVMAAGVESDI